MQKFNKNWERVSFGSKNFSGQVSKLSSRSLNLGSLSRSIISHWHLIHRFGTVLQRTVFSKSTLQGIRTQPGRNRRLGLAKRSIRLDPLERRLFMRRSRVRKGLEEQRIHFDIRHSWKINWKFTFSVQFWTKHLRTCANSTRLIVKFAWNWKERMKTVKKCNMKIFSLNAKRSKNYEKSKIKIEK